MHVSGSPYSAAILVPLEAYEWDYRSRQSSTQTTCMENNLILFSSTSSKVFFLNWHHVISKIFTLTSGKKCEQISLRNKRIFIDLEAMLGKQTGKYLRRDIVHQLAL